MRAEAANQGVFCRAGCWQPIAQDDEDRADGWTMAESSSCRSEGPSVPDADVFVGLRLQGAFDPDDITRRLGLAATHQRRVGERSRPIWRPPPGSVWSLDSAGRVEADTIEPHLEWLLDLIEPVASDLATVVAEGATASAECYWASVGRAGGPWIAPRSMQRLAALDTCPSSSRSTRRTHSPWACHDQPASGPSRCCTSSSPSWATR